VGIKAIWQACFEMPYARPVLKDDKTLSCVWIDRKVCIDDLKFNDKFVSGYWFDCRACKKNLLDTHNKETGTVSTEKKLSISRRRSSCTRK
jgi:hypothetical protein